MARKAGLTVERPTPMTFKDGDPQVMNCTFCTRPFVMVGGTAYSVHRYGTGWRSMLTRRHVNAECLSLWMAAKRKLTTEERAAELKMPRLAREAVGLHE